MAPYYKEVCEEFGLPLDEKFYAEMKEANDKRLQELDTEHERNMMDEEDQVSGIWQAKLDYLCSIGDRAEAFKLANAKFSDKTNPKSHRIDAVFTLFRIAYFHGCDIQAMTDAIEKATELIEGNSPHNIILSCIMQSCNLLRLVEQDINR